MKATKSAVARSNSPETARAWFWSKSYQLAPLRARLPDQAGA